MPSDGKRFVSPKDLADRYNVSSSKLQRWRVEGDGPPFVRLGHNTVRYELSAVEQWERDQLRQGQQ